MGSLVTVPQGVASFQDDGNVDAGADELRRKAWRAAGVTAIPSGVPTLSEALFTLTHASLRRKTFSNSSRHWSEMGFCRA